MEFVIFTVVAFMFTVLAEHPGMGKIRPKPSTARATQSQSLALREFQSATASGPVNSIAMAKPKGMVLMAL